MGALKRLLECPLVCGSPGMGYTIVYIYTGIYLGSSQLIEFSWLSNDDVIKWKHFPCCWSFVRGIQRHRWIPLTKASDALMFSLICVWTNGWANNPDAGDLRRHRTHYYVTVMIFSDKIVSDLGRSYSFEIYQWSTRIVALFETI